MRWGDSSAEREGLVAAEAPHRILEEHRKLTGVGTVVSTSIDRRESPIVCAPEDALRASLLDHSDYLAIGTLLVGNPRREPVVGEPLRRRA